MSYKDKVIKTLEFIETKKGIKENTKFLIINLLRYINKCDYINIFNLLNKSREEILETYEEEYKNRIKNQEKKIKPYLFSNILYDTSEAEILMNFKKQLDVDYYKIKELIEKDDYETIYKSINVLFTNFILFLSLFSVFLSKTNLLPFIIASLIFSTSTMLK